MNCKLVNFDSFCKELNIRKRKEAKNLIQIIASEGTLGAWVGCDRALNSRLNLSRPAQQSIVNKFVEEGLITRNAMPRSGVAYRVNRKMLTYLLGGDETKKITDNVPSGKVESKKVTTELYQIGKNRNKKEGLNFTREEKREKDFETLKPYNSIYYTIDDSPLNSQDIKNYNIIGKQPIAPNIPYPRISKTPTSKNQIYRVMEKREYTANLMDVIDSHRKLRSRMSRKARKLDMDYFEFADSFCEYCYNYNKEIRRNGAGVDKLIDIHAGHLGRKRAQEAFRPSESDFAGDIDYIFDLLRKMDYTGTYVDEKGYGVHASGIPIENHEENEKKALATMFRNNIANKLDIITMVNYAKRTNNQNFFPNIARYEGQWWRLKEALATIPKEYKEMVEKKVKKGTKV